MLDVYKRHQCSVIGLKRTPLAEVSAFGAVAGILKRDIPNGVCVCTLPYLPAN
jgi:UTP-glucose-1-phosphate uridylyltransferase